MEVEEVPVPRRRICVAAGKLVASQSTARPVFTAPLCCTVTHLQRETKTEGVRERGGAHRHRDTDILVLHRHAPAGRVR